MIRGLGPHVRRDSGGVGSELDAQGLHDAEPPAVGPTAIGRERDRREGCSRGFARDAGAAGELAHSDGARDVAEGGRDKSGVAVLEGGFEIGGDGLGTVEVFGGVPEGGFKWHFEPHTPFGRAVSET